MNALKGMRNLGDRSRREDVTRNAFKKLEGLHPPNLLQKVCAHMNLKNATIRSTQADIDALIMEQWVTFHVDDPDNTFRQLDGMYAAVLQLQCARLRALTCDLVRSTQLPMQRFGQKLQHLARRN